MFSHQEYCTENVQLQTGAPTQQTQLYQPKPKLYSACEWFQTADTFMMIHFNTSTVSWKQPLRNSKQHNKIPIQNILQNFWNKCSQMGNNCKCLSSAQCSSITIINANHLRYWGFKSFGMWCCVTGLVVSHILKDRVAFRPSRNGLQCMVTEDYGSHKMTKNTIPPHSEHANKIFLWCQWYQAVHVHQYVTGRLYVHHQGSGTTQYPAVQHDKPAHEWVQKYLALATILTEWQQSFVYLLGT
jgi:hypothetical protein